MKVLQTRPLTEQERKQFVCGMEGVAPYLIPLSVSKLASILQPKGKAKPSRRERKQRNRSRQ